jgi:hypothetical protein
MCNCIKSNTNLDSNIYVSDISDDDTKFGGTKKDFKTISQAISKSKKSPRGANNTSFDSNNPKNVYSNSGLYKE